MHARKFGLALCAALLAMTGLVQAQQPLKVAGLDAEPFVVRDKTSASLSGIAVELINAISKDAGFQVEFQPMNSADLIPAVASGKIDIIASNLVISPERKEQVDFADPYYSGRGETLVAATSDTMAYQSLADLKGLPVGAVKSSIQANLLQKTGGFSEIKLYDKNEEAWAAIGVGQVKVVLSPNSSTTYLARTGRLPANVKIVTSYEPVLKNLVGIAVKKGNAELLGRINKSQAKLADDGTIKAIFAKYGFEWTQPK